MTTHELRTDRPTSIKGPAFGAGTLPAPEWNATHTAFAADRTLVDLFHDQVRRSPDRIAVVDALEQLTYAQLHARSSQLARLLRQHDIGPESIVALCFERSAAMIVGMLAVLEAGGAYLPLDPESPSKRLAYQLEDSKAKLLLAQDSLPAEPIAGCAIAVLRIGGASATPSSVELVPVPTPPKPADLAYLIYTSGSTGRPKGVMVPHSALYNHMMWMQSAYPLSASDVVLQKTSSTFDASVWEIFAPLAWGARLVLAKPGGQKDAGYLSEAVQAHGVTVLQLVPTMLQEFLRQPTVQRCTSLKHVFSGGEALTAELRDRLFEKLGADLHNLYGPTETCIQIVSYTCERGDRRKFVPIGRPISNVQLYVLNEDLQRVPVGAAGELYIGGAALARGYIGQPALTEERFVPNPFDAQRSRLYRTGDLVSYLPDGTLQFLGRADNQVKLRGFRIELGECEAVLREHPGVSQAIVTAVPNAAGETYLVAHVVTKPGAMLSAQALRDYAGTLLPEYMRVAKVLFLDALPLLPSGKVDRNALTKQAAVAPSPSEVSVAASESPIERIVGEMCGSVLGLTGLDGEADFFDLGGTSLGLMRVLANANEHFGTAVDMSVVSQGATVADLARAFEQAIQFKEARGQ